VGRARRAGRLLDELGELLDELLVELDEADELGELLGRRLGIFLILVTVVVEEGRPTTICDQ